MPQVDLQLLLLFHRQKSLKLILLRKLGYFNIKLDSYKKSNQNKKNYKGTSSNIEKDFCVVDKNGKNIKVNGYQLYQFLTGEILDAFYIIKSKLSTGNIDEANQELFLTILNIIKYLIYEVKNNLNKYKNAYFNRKLLIVSKIHAILVSFEPIIANLTTIVHYNYGNIREIEFEFKSISTWPFSSSSKIPFIKGFNLLLSISTVSDNLISFKFVNL